jgi:glycosyltransferase involved in cell wall biosynthesis
VLQPDPQILWYRNAVRAATAHLRTTRHDAILVTAPPYSSFLIGTALKRRFGLPLVLDYRDEWDLSSRYLENAQRDWASQAVQERMQRSILRQADAVVATTQSSVRRLQRRLSQVGRLAHTSCIYNGFDAEDFEGHAARTVVPAQAPGTFRIVYTGTLWNLTTIAPLIAALEQLSQQSAELAARVELVCVGRKTPEQLALLNRLATTACRLVNVDYCDHPTAIAWLRSADALCLLLSDVLGAERVVPAKLFEYLAIRKDVLALMPEGEAAGLIRRFHPEGWYSPSDIAGITQWLHARLDCIKACSSHPTIDADDIAEFSRERQTDRLLDLLDALTTSAPTGRAI